MKSLIVAIGIVFLSITGVYAQVSSPELEQIAKDYTARLTAKAAADHRSSIELLRDASDEMAKGRLAQAIDALEVLTGRSAADGGSSHAWLQLALAWQAYDGLLHRSEPRAEILAAAYSAYRTADNDFDRVEALSLLGSLLWRSAVENPSETQAANSNNATNTANQNSSQSQSRPAKRVIENRQSARRLAYQVFTELGRLTSADRYAKQLDALAPTFKLKSVSFPPPPVKVDTSYETSRCEAWRDTVNDNDSLGGNLAGSTGSQQNRTNAPKGDSKDATGPQMVHSKADDCHDDPPDQVCLTFTRDLLPKLDEIGPRIAVENADGKPLPGQGRFLASVNGGAVCYSGLKYGSTYRFEIKQTLQANDGTKLARPAIAIVTMPDYLPSVTFTAGRYVLPSAGSQLIPMVPINIRAADLALRRIGDYSLMQELALKHVLGQLQPSSACDVLNKIGAKIADGRIRFHRQRNDLSAVDIPIGKVLRARQQWLAKKDRTKVGNYPDSGLDLSMRLLAGRGNDAADITSKRAGVYVLLARIGDRNNPPAEDDSAADSDNGQCGHDISFQWFVVTNIGLTVQRSLSHIYAVARSLDSGKPLAGVTIRFLARSGALIEEVKTDSRGLAEIPARLGRGTGGNTLTAVTATLGEDFTFIDMTADAVDLSDRGFEGAKPGGLLDAFIAPSRGIFRPGEVLDALVLVRGPDGHAIDRPPPIRLSLLPETPQGTPLKTGDTEKPLLPIRGPLIDPSKTPLEDGGFLVKFNISDLVREGHYRLDASVYGESIGSIPIEIRYYQPHTVRIAPQTSTWSGTLSAGGHFELKGTAHADYLYGRENGNGAETDAPAANLSGAIEVRVHASNTLMPGCLDGFSFGSSRANIPDQMLRRSTLATGAHGTLSVPVIGDGLTQPNAPLVAAVKLSLFDAGGTVAEKSFEVPVKSVGRRWIGLRLHRAIVGAGQAQIDVVELDADNRPVPNERLQVTVFRERTTLVVRRDGAGWQFVTSDRANREQIGTPWQVKTGPATAGACPHPTSFPVKLGEPGRYIIHVTDGNGATTELAVGDGKTTSPDGSQKPDSLIVRTRAQPPGNNGVFKRGDTITVGIESPYNTATALVEFMHNGTVVASTEAKVSDGRATTSVKIGNDWPEGGMYVYATAFRRAVGDRIENGPGRAIGGTFIQIMRDSATPKLSFSEASQEASATALQNGSLPFTLTLTGFAKDARVTVAAVDEGVLLVTDFKTPDPWQHYFGQRRFDFTVFDTYGRVLYPKVGGGDIPLEPLRDTDYVARRIVKWHSGILHAVNGQVQFSLPPGTVPRNFLGRLRLMAWAWDEKGVASAAHMVRVSSSVIVRLAPPRAMAPGDIALMPLEVRNLGNRAARTVPVEITASDGIELLPKRSRPTPKPCRFEKNLNRCQEFDLDARKGAAPSHAIIGLQGMSQPTGDKATAKLAMSYSPTPTSPLFSESWSVPLRLPYPKLVVASKERRVIAPGATMTLTGDTIAQVRSASGLRQAQVGLRIAPQGLLAIGAEQARTDIHNLNQLASLLQMLLASTADPSKVPSQYAMINHDQLQKKLDELVAEMSVLQQPDGGFISDSRARRKFGSDKHTYFEKTPSLGETTFALDVLARAKKAGVTVSTTLLNRAAGFVYSNLPSSFYDGGCDRTDAYALSVLARLDRVPPANFRFIADNCSKLLQKDQTAQLMLAAAYNSFGYPTQAETLERAVMANAAPLAGSPSEGARAVSLYLESQPATNDPRPFLTKVKAESLQQSQSLDVASWFARADSAALSILHKHGTSFDFSKLTTQPVIAFNRMAGDGVAIKALPAGGLSISNHGNAPLEASLVATGIPTSISQANNANFSVHVSLDQSALAPGQVRKVKQFQVQHFVVEINQTGSYNNDQRIVVEQALPTGFEGVDRSFELSWLSEVGNSVDQHAFSALDDAEFRGDKWIALPQMQKGPQHLLLAFSLRPTLAGQFLLPPLVVRDFNNPDRVAWSAPLRLIVEPAKTP